MNLVARRGDAADENEVPFEIDEIFYSRTDSRGVIVAGNSVFRRVSGYDWPRLIGAPHKIVRHPDMPKAVFWLLWETIRAGQPVGAYVKNRAQDGRHYWVFAVVMPMQDGFLSVRIKPSSPIFERIREEYAALRQRELDEDLSPQASAQILLAQLGELGFGSYSDFMAQALGREIAARSEVSGTRGMGGLRDLETVGQNLTSAAVEQQALGRTYRDLQSIPTNIRIFANRVEPAGGPLTAIAENYRTASQEIFDRLRAFAGQDGNLCERMSRVVSDGMFLLGCAEVQSELVRQFGIEGNSVGPNDKAAEMALLSTKEAACAARARAGLAEAMRVAHTLSQTCQEIRRIVLGLDSIRVMGQVECARLRDNGTGLVAAIDELDHFHSEIKARLDTIAKLSDQIHGGAGRFLERLSA
ncbi:PAS domain-containing protein [Rhodovulum euryhalinum]|uniref:Aerotaxis receptor n=1 Tax=Rhodovulum euryhalinum TaxID=35805 RepID=A0A4R2KFU7_9RHOB|nr:PAS domain-containing protein [Rhodovulum euryhalinum]TCO69286.1 aerotaxis receptor [Rhodovulum euryhalinum]